MGVVLKEVLDFLKFVYTLMKVISKEYYSFKALVKIIQ